MQIASTARTGLLGTARSARQLCIFEPKAAKRAEPSGLLSAVAICMLCFALERGDVSYEPAQ